MNSTPQTGRTARYVDPPTLPRIPVAQGHSHDDLWRSPAGERADTDAFPAVRPVGRAPVDDSPTVWLPVVGRDVGSPTVGVGFRHRGARQARESDRLGVDGDDDGLDRRSELDGDTRFGDPAFDGTDFEGTDSEGPNLDDPDFAGGPDPDIDGRHVGARYAEGGDPDDPDQRAGVPVPAATARGGRGRRGRRRGALIVPVAVGIALSVGLGVYARLHVGTGVALDITGFSSGLAAKTWLTAAAFVFGLVQLGTATVLSGRIGRGAGRGTHLLHRWSGRVAVLLTIPVAVHCLYALGFGAEEVWNASPRVLAHALLGCFFYGAFATKMLLLDRRGTPGWALPVFGGVVFTLLTGVFLTSSVWFFTTKGLVF